MAAVRGWRTKGCDWGLHLVNSIK
ncbi:hypothetical protein EMIT0111MI5_90262 [Burkholderia sp. IT-111MI5]